MTSVQLVACILLLAVAAGSLRSIEAFQPIQQWNIVFSSRTETYLWSESRNTTSAVDETPLAERLALSRNPRNRKRTRDYPSFAYDETSARTRKKIENIKMKYRASGCDDVTFQKPPSVTIPGQNTVSMSFFDQAALGFFGGFEGGLPINIGISAARTRLLKNRSYAKKAPFALANITVPPSLADLTYPPTQREKGFWVTIPARLATGVVAFFTFPYLTRFLDSFVTIPPEDLDAITSKFGPGVSILYGTFISLTLSILYQRVKDIQDAASRESAMLTYVTRNLLSIFKTDRQLAVEAAQCCADQVRTLVRTSRGGELMLVMYGDPYARMMELIEFREEELYAEKGDFGPHGVRFCLLCR